MRINDQPSPFYLAEITQDKRKSHKSETRQNLPNTQDSVSISAEAFALAQEMYVQNKIELTFDREENSDAIRPSIAGTNIQASVESGPTQREIFNSFLYDSKGRRNKVAGSSSTGSIEEQIEAIEKRIEQLQGQIEKIASSDEPEAVKESQIDAIKGQISALSSQKSSLEGTRLKESTASSAK